MFYIDDYNSKTITNSPPKKEDRIELAKTKMEMDSKQLSAFWYLAGATIAHNYDEVKILLEKYGYQVTNEKDAASAIADMIGTPKWTKFVKEFGDVIEGTIDEQVLQQLNAEESGWVEAIIQAVGSVASPSLGLATSLKQLKATQENAKAQMLTGITATMDEIEKTERATKAEIEKTEEKKNTMWIVLAVILIIVIIGIVIYKRRKAQASA